MGWGHTLCWGKSGLIFSNLNENSFNQLLMPFNFHLSDFVQILHRPWQIFCHGMCKIWTKSVIQKMTNFKNFNGQFHQYFCASLPIICGRLPEGHLGGARGEPGSTLIGREPNQSWGTQEMVNRDFAHFCWYVKRLQMCAVAPFTNLA